MFLSNEMNCWRIRIDKGPDAYLIPLLGSREAVIMLCDPIFAPSLKRRNEIYKCELKFMLS